jgi:hypothetical protein
MVDIDFTVKKEGGVQAGTPLSPDISHRIEGGEDLEAAIQSSLRQLGIPVLGALVEEGEDIMAVSKERVPKRTGALQASGRVQVTQSGQEGIEVMSPRMALFPTRPSTRWTNTRTLTTDTPKDAPGSTWNSP